MQLFENNAWGTLAATITSGATSLTLTAGQGARFPTPTGGDYFLLTLIALDGNGAESAWEIVKVTARSTDTLTIVRAQDGTTAIGWNSGTRCEMRVTQGTLDNFAQGPSSLTPVANKIPLADANARVDGDWIGVLADKLTTAKDAFNELTAVQQYLIMGMEGLAGYWPADPAYLFEDSAGTIPASVSGVVGSWRQLGPAPVYTPVTVTNPGFDTDTGWIKGVGATIADGVATLYRADFGEVLIYQNLSLAPYTAYRITLDLTIIAGGCSPYFSGGGTVGSTVVKTSGRHQFVIISGAANTAFGISFAGTSVSGTVDNVVIESIANWGASQSTTANKPYLRKTSTSGVYWLDSNTATSALTATLGNLGASCTVVQAGAEGVTFTEGVTISSTYNIAPSFGFNGDVAIFDRALTVSEKALLTRYMQRGVPVLGANLVTNGTFDTDTTGWTIIQGTGAVVDGKLRVTNSGALNGYATQVAASGATGKTFIFAGTAINGTNSLAQIRPANAPSTYTAAYGYLSQTSVFPVFVATGSSIQMVCIGGAVSNGYNDYDNISLKEIL